jgi:HD-like signal output (HDOD) protein
MKNIVEKSLQFPPVKQSIQNTLRLIEDLETPIENIANAIAQDAVLASTVLKLANSPFYGVSKKVVSIAEAAVLLGRFSLKNVILSLAFNDKLNAIDNIPIDRQSLWNKSLLTGCIGRELSRHADLNKELTLTIGILHKIGKLVLAWADPERYQQVIDFQQTFEEPDYLAEKKLLLHDHAEIGKTILLKWKVPEEIALTIGKYTQQYQSPSDRPAALLALASYLAENTEHINEPINLDSQIQPLLLYLEIPPERLLEAKAQASQAKSSYRIG